MDTNKQEFKSINSEKDNARINQVIESIQKDFLDTNPDDIKLSMPDLQNILNKKGTIHAVNIKCTGEDKALKDLEFFMQDPSLDIQSLNKISSVLISFRIPTDYPIAKLSKVVESMYEKIDYNSDFIWGTATDDLLDKDLTIINGLFIETQVN